jgi:hypothetical protein
LWEGQLPVLVSTGSAKRPHKFEPLLDHVFWNGLGFNFLGETTVALMALHYGATNFQMGLLGSLSMLCGLLLIHYPMFYQNRDPVKLYQSAWNLRGWICLGYLLVLLLPDHLAVWLILFIYGLFSLIRMSGVALFPIIQRGLTTSDNRGTLLTRMSVRFNASTVLSRVVSTWILRLTIFTGVFGLFFIQALGFFANALAARSLDRIPPMKPLSLGKIPTMLERLKMPWTNGSLNFILIMHIVNHGLMILMAFLIPTLVRLHHFDKSSIFLFALMTAMGGVASGLFLERAFNWFSSRAILTSSLFFYALSVVFWIFLPLPLSPFWIDAAGFFSSFVFSLVFTCVNRDFLATLPAKNTIGFTAVTYFLIAVAALILGTSIGWLADLGQWKKLPFAHDYSWVFVTALLLVVFNFFLHFLQLRRPVTKGNHS